MTEFADINLLVKLFKPNDDNDSDSDNDNPSRRPQADVPPETAEPKVSPYAQLKPAEVRKEVGFDEDAVPESSTDWKKTPKWNISYRQKVTASDVFLQMGAKTPSTASCEDMIMAIDLPGEHMQNIDIKVLRDKLEVTSPNFALNIPLPQPVDPQKGHAQWDSAQERLNITLTMSREFDFINF